MVRRDLGDELEGSSGFIGVYSLDASQVSKIILRFLWFARYPLKIANINNGRMGVAQRRR